MSEWVLTASQNLIIGIDAADTSTERSALAVCRLVNGRLQVCRFVSWTGMVGVEDLAAVILRQRAAYARHRKQRKARKKR